MRAERRFAGAALLALLVLWAPPAAAQFCVTAAEPEGAGGTGRAGGDGVGGTGAPAPRGEEPGGIGGTGLWSSGDDDGIGGTGIEGTITGFGSLCVNGLRVGYDDATVVTSDGAPIAAARLRRGDVVRIAASRAAPRCTRSIELRHEVVGRSRLDAAGGVMEVLGQRVHLGAGTRVDDATAAAGAARPARTGRLRARRRTAPGRRRDRRVARRAHGSDAEVGITGRVDARRGAFAIGGQEFELSRAWPADRRRRARMRADRARGSSWTRSSRAGMPFAGTVGSVSSSFPRALPGARRLELGGVAVDLSDLPELGDDVVQKLEGATRACRWTPGADGACAPSGSRSSSARRGAHLALDRAGRRLAQRRDRDDLGESLLEDAELFEYGSAAAARSAERPEREERVERPERPEREERPERRSDRRAGAPEDDD
jgi:hypothetical protein